MKKIEKLLEQKSKKELISIILSERKKKFGLKWDKEYEREKVVLKCLEKFPVFLEIEKNRIIGKNNSYLIEGDNYHSLLTLSYTHKEMIDVIYIDPPYNTGKKDFQYNDKFIDELDTFRHSKWLNFMEKRLQLAYELLKNDGFIAISIDENEFCNLKLLMDSIFGENNRLTTQHIQVRYANKSLNEKKDFQEIIEYCLIYAKDKSRVKVNKPVVEYNSDNYIYEIKEINVGKTIEMGGKKVEVFKPNDYEIVKHNNSDFKYLKSTWASGSVLNGNTSGKFFKQHLMNRKKEDGLNVLYKVYGIGEDGLGYRYFTGPKKASAIRGQFYSKVPLDQLEKIANGDTNVSKPIINFYDYSADFGNIVHEGGVSYNSGKKPVKFLKNIINYHPSKNALVLDFFAGSASTGHAVWDLNKDDNGNRRFILCQKKEKINIAKEKAYQRLKNCSNNNGLIYLKTDFLKVEESKDDMKVSIVKKLNTSLMLRENTFNIAFGNEYYTVAFEDKKYILIYNWYFDDKIDEVLDLISRENIDIAKIYYYDNINIYEYFRKKLSNDKIKYSEIPSEMMNEYFKMRGNIL